MSYSKLLVTCRLVWLYTLELPTNNISSEKRRQPQSDHVNKVITSVALTRHVGCRLDQHGKSEVPQRELIDFEKQYDIPIIGISNLSPSPPAAGPEATGTDLRTTAPVLNCLCERLWYRDQQEAGLVI